MKTGIFIRIGRLLFTSEISEVAESLGYYAINSEIALMSATAKCITSGRSLVSLFAVLPGLGLAYEFQYKLSKVYQNASVCWFCRISVPPESTLSLSGYAIALCLR